MSADIDVSVLIPARNEMFLLPTIQDVLAHREARTEIIAVLDGAWPVDPIPDHPDVHLIYHPESTGQRASINEAARVARGRYFMKLDAHCAVDQGFDRKLMQPYEDGEIDPDTTTIPRLYNLHVFDWTCGACGNATYQGPEPTVCKPCGATGPFTRTMRWQPRWNRQTDFARFDTTPQFQYWSAYKKRPEADGDLVDLMCSVGACFFQPRDWYWALGGCDEATGSWGQQGIEVACKAWLAGGRQIVNKRTWYSHLFRTQPGFGFPYPQSEKAVQRARDYSRRTWFHNEWSEQVRPMGWLLDKFKPVPGWHDDTGKAALAEVQQATAWWHKTHRRTAGIVYYSDGRLDRTLLDACQAQLKRAAGDLPMVSVTLTPMPTMGDNVWFHGERARLTMFKQILAGLHRIDTDDVFLCEHDVLYHPSHFDFRPVRRDRVYYNEHVYRVDTETGKTVTYHLRSVSGCCANRDLLIQLYRELVADVEANGYDHRRGYEVGVREGMARNWRAPWPNVDLRHGLNLTASRWTPSAFRDATTCRGWTETDDVPGWGQTTGRFGAFLQAVSEANHDATDPHQRTPPVLA